MKTNLRCTVSITATATTFLLSSSYLRADTRDFHVWSPGKAEVHVEILDYNPATGAFHADLYKWNQCAKWRTGPVANRSNPEKSSENAPQTIANIPWNNDGTLSTWQVKILNVDDPHGPSYFAKKGAVIAVWDPAQADFQPGGNMNDAIVPLPDNCAPIAAGGGKATQSTYGPNDTDCAQNPNLKGCPSAGGTIPIMTGTF